MIMLATTTTTTTMTSVIPFAEIKADARVRCARINGRNYLSVRDIIMAVCDQNNNRANETWRNILKDHKFQEVNDFFVNHQFEGPGQSEQPVLTLGGALELIMVLPGNNAKKYRAQAAKLLIRFAAGDPSLMAELLDNAASDAPVNVMAREELRAVDNDAAAAEQTMMMMDTDRLQASMEAVSLGVVSGVTAAVAGVLQAAQASLLTSVEAIHAEQASIIATNIDAMHVDMGAMHVEHASLTTAVKAELVPEVQDLRNGLVQTVQKQADASRAAAELLLAKESAEKARHDSHVRRGQLSGINKPRFRQYEGQITRLEAEVSDLKRQLRRAARERRDTLAAHRDALAALERQHALWVADVKAHYEGGIRALLPTT